VTVYRHVGGRINDKVILQIATLGMIRPLGDILIVHHKGEWSHHNSTLQCFMLTVVGKSVVQQPSRMRI
jgi:hypothetical protein